MPFTKESHDEKTIKYLLGPMKDLPEDERMILNHAKYCDILNFDKKKKSEQDNTIDTSNLLFIPHTTFPKVFIRQTYKMWKAAMDIGWRLRKAKKRRVIYIQPLEEFPEFISKFEFDSTVGFFEFLKRFTSLFFGGFLVRLLEPLDMDAAGWNITTRTQKITGQKQFLVTDIQKRLQKALPKDGFCILGITWTDLYPSDGLNFVFGDANSAYSSGVFSFGRFEPRRFKEGNPPIPIEHIDGYLIWKMIKVCCHHYHWLQAIRCKTTIFKMHHT